MLHGWCILLRGWEMQYLTQWHNLLCSWLCEQERWTRSGVVGNLVCSKLPAVSLSSNSCNLLFSAFCKKRSWQVWAWSWFHCSLGENSLFGSEGEYLAKDYFSNSNSKNMSSEPSKGYLYVTITIDQMETNLALNFSPANKTWILPGIQKLIIWKVKLERSKYIFGTLFPGTTWMLLFYWF